MPSGERRPDPREVLLRWRAIVGQPLAEVFVRLTEPAERQQHVDQDEAEEHHRGDEQRVSGEQRDDEDPNRVLGPNLWEKRSARPFGRGSSTGGTDARASSRGRDSRAEDRGDGDSLRLGVHGVVFTRRDTWVKHRRSAPSKSMPFLVLLLISLLAGALVAYLGSRYPTPVVGQAPARERRSTSRRRWSGIRGSFGSFADASTLPRQPASRSRSRSGSR